VRKAGLTKAGLRQIPVDSLATSQSQRHYAYPEASSDEPTAVELAEFEADFVSVVEVEEADDEYRHPLVGLQQHACLTILVAAVIIASSASVTTSFAAISFSEGCRSPPTNHLSISSSCWRKTQSGL
jgi:hypothetical protein